MAESYTIQLSLPYIASQDNEIERVWVTIAKCKTKVNLLNEQCRLHKLSQEALYHSQRANTSGPGLYTVTQGVLSKFIPS